MAKKIMLSKYFERDQANDFSDDGTFFRCYRTPDDIEVTIARNGSNIYLDAKIEEVIDNDIRCLDEDYFKLCQKASECSGKYNGCYEGNLEGDALEVWAEDLHYYFEKLTKYEKPKPTIYFNTVDEKYYGYKYEKNYWGSTVSKNFGLIYVSKERLDKFNIKRLVVEE